MPPGRRQSCRYVRAHHTRPLARLQSEIWNGALQFGSRACLALPNTGGGKGQGAGKVHLHRLQKVTQKNLSQRVSLTFRVLRARLGRKWGCSDIAVCALWRMQTRRVPTRILSGVILAVLVAETLAFPAGFSITTVAQGGDMYVDMIWIDATRALLLNRFGQVDIVAPNTPGFPTEKYIKVCRK